MKLPLGATTGNEWDFSRKHNGYRSKKHRKWLLTDSDTNLFHSICQNLFHQLSGNIFVVIFWNKTVLIAFIFFQNFLKFSPKTRPISGSIFKFENYNLSIIYFRPGNLFWKHFSVISKFSSLDFIIFECHSDTPWTSRLNRANNGS